MAPDSESIWTVRPDIEALNAAASNTLMAQLGIEITAVKDDGLRGSMPVDRRTHQPLAMLHGGASAALAETLGSVAGSFVVDPQRQFVVGVELNINHLRPVSRGFVHGSASPFHLGATTQVWGIEITDPDGRLIAVARLTLAVRTRQGNKGSNVPIFPSGARQSDPSQ